jgi:predicted nuclease of restriction endonuclease-like (RecB) superfamily
MDKAYIDWIEDRKLKIRPAQLKASVAVSEEMILLYWDIGKSMPEKQGEFSWGNKIVEQMAKDLKREIPDTNGFSRTNLFAMRKFYLFYKDDAFVHQPGGQIKDSFELVHEAGGQLTRDSILCKIPRRHHIAILGNCNSTGKAKFYIQQIIQNNWSRNVLEMQLESKLIERQGRAANNSELTLSKPLSDLRRHRLRHRRQYLGKACAVHGKLYPRAAVFSTGAPEERRLYYPVTRPGGSADPLEPENNHPRGGPVASAGKAAEGMGGRISEGQRYAVERKEAAAMRRQVEGVKGQEAGLFSRSFQCNQFNHYYGSIFCWYAVLRRRPRSLREGAAAHRQGHRRPLWLHARDFHAFPPRRSLRRDQRMDGSGADQ